ncbi:hypothetical protein TUMSATVNIG1_59230 (plasmid) [Vibrio nigripulchritudo]|uniref:hypothetical protein n=1 Tax=Vibrio nigripulchritudo TaxID=28173 RepID=UPI00190C000D|nr:hypothetical protein [Vibrio nigripulchritudo]BCL73938.1 hypothetical protein VNTUMSATTG_58750 [Vibrio nigripulchritudo]BDU35314.1 hypothetical protein TUMSATVNIG1_59230 [Vibrio nigripulchritudo]
MTSSIKSIPQLFSQPNVTKVTTQFALATLTISLTACGGGSSDGNGTTNSAGDNSSSANAPTTTSKEVLEYASTETQLFYFDFFAHSVELDSLTRVNNTYRQDKVERINTDGSLENISNDANLSFTHFINNEWRTFQAQRILVIENDRLVGSMHEDFINDSQHLLEGKVVSLAGLPMYKYLPSSEDMISESATFGPGAKAIETKDYVLQDTYFASINGSKISLLNEEILVHYDYGDGKAVKLTTLSPALLVNETSKTNDQFSSVEGFTTGSFKTQLIADGSLKTFYRVGDKDSSFATAREARSGSWQWEDLNGQNAIVFSLDTPNNSSVYKPMYTLVNGQVVYASKLPSGSLLTEKVPSAYDLNYIIENEYLFNEEAKQDILNALIFNPAICNKGDKSVNDSSLSSIDLQNAVGGCNVEPDVHFEESDVRNKTFVVEHNQLTIRNMEFKSDVHGNNKVIGFSSEHELPSEMTWELDPLTNRLIIKDAVNQGKFKWEWVLTSRDNGSLNVKALRKSSVPSNNSHIESFELYETY